MTAWADLNPEKRGKQDWPDPEFGALAEEVCTAKELEAWKLWEEELSYYRIATILNLSVSAVRGRIDRALRKIELALESAA